MKNPENIKVVKILEVEASLEEIEAGFGFISSNWPKWYFAFRPNPSTCSAINTCKINIGKVCPLPKAGCFSWNLPPRQREWKLFLVLH